MRDLNIYKLPLESITLEQIDIFNKQHIKAIKGLRDIEARRMCYDLKQDIYYGKRGTLIGNNFLLRKDNNYIGYLFISNEWDGCRTLSYIINKKMRGRWLGTIVLTSVSDYLLNNGFATSIELNVKHKNIAGNLLALKCGFIKKGSSGCEVENYFKKKVL